MGILTKTIDKYIYPDYQDNWDIFLFRDRIKKHLKADSVVLDLGAGAGIIPLDFKGQVLRVCGVDPDQRVLQNPYLDEAKTGCAESIPYDDETFDIVICMHLLEHLCHPQDAFKEIHRVLKPKGSLFIKTTNKYHYVPVLAQITPLCFHKFYNKLRGRETEDTFPTYYRANSERQINRYAESTGFSIESLELIEGRPEYLRLTWPAYLIGSLIEKIVNSTRILRNFRVVMLVTMRK